MLTKTIQRMQRIERILLNEMVDRYVRAAKFTMAGGLVTYAAWYGLDFTRCGAHIAACVMFASLSTLLGLVALFTLSGTGDEREGG